MTIALPRYFFRTRENGAVLFKTPGNNR